ncbi:hypothetical protein [Flavobacterium sp. H122]|uniref:hypothetical protein n=1 Tax=Flavobacterium sp. H122 TaxID=2529860 RepID=UPI0010AB4185|nr:hypothetical protein [Flavobacterium sp. H122]
MSKKRKDFILIFSLFGVLLTCAMIFFYLNEGKSEVTGNELGTCKTPEEAFRETQKALNLLSLKINSGIKNAEEIKEYELTKNKIFKNEK